MDLYRFQPEGVDSFGVDADSASLLDCAFDTSSVFVGSHASLDKIDSRCEDNDYVTACLVKLRMRLEHLRTRLLQYRQQHAYDGLSRLYRRLEKSMAVVKCLLQDNKTRWSDSLQHGVNTHYVELMLTALEHETGVVSVCTSRTTNNGRKDGNRERIEVDIISCQGLRWLKLRTASSKQLQEEVNRPGWEAAIARLLQAARANRLPFKQTPEVVVLFRDHPPPVMSDVIRRMGARPLSCAALHAQVGSCIPLQCWCDTEFLPSISFHPNFVCFDTTALVGACSEACFAKCPEENVAALREFPVMAEQQRKEIRDPCVAHHLEPALTCYTTWYDADDFTHRICDSVRQRDVCSDCMPTVKDIDVTWLEKLVAATSLPGDDALPLEESALVRSVYEKRKGRLALGEAESQPNWIIADITLTEFRWILETIAGPMELRRALTLLQCCRVVSMDRRCLDADAPLLTYVSLLAASKSVSERNRLVFALADAVMAVVLSSNRQVLHAAELEGVRLLVKSHPARALVEQKLYGLSRRDGPQVPPPIDADGSCR